MKEIVPSPLSIGAPFVCINAPWIMIAFPDAGFVHTLVNSPALRETPLVLKIATSEKLKCN